MNRILGILMAVAVTAVLTASVTSWAADPTLRDFPDTYESAILDPNTGWGGKNVPKLGGMLAAIHGELLDAHRRVACNGATVLADRAALTALAKADLATALADADCSVLYATVLDDGGGDPRKYRWDSASTATSVNALSTDEGGAGRWVAVEDDIASVNGSPVTQAFLAIGADRVAGDDAGATTGSGLEFTNKHTLTSSALAAGQKYRIRASVLVPSQNATDNLTLTLFLGGTSGLDIAEVAAYDAANDDALSFDVTLTIGGTGASGFVFVHGASLKDSGGTASSAAASIVGETVDLTGDPTLSLAALWGSASATNQADLRYFEVTAIPAP